MPWQIHFSGKSAAIVCIQDGSSENTKKTPEMNCSTIEIGETIAGAVRPFVEVVKGTVLVADVVIDHVEDDGEAVLVASVDERA